MHKAVLILLLIAVASPVWAEWSKTGEANDRTSYIDYTSLRKNGHLVKAWGLVDLKKKEEIGHSSLVFINEFDCREERRRKLSVYFFSGQMGLGETIAKLTEPEEWEYIRPGEQGYFVLPLVCHDWVKIGRDLYIDPVTIRKNRQFATVWLLLDRMQGDKYGALSLRSQYEYDCEGKRVRDIDMSGHSDLMASGDILFFMTGAKKWKYVELFDSAFEYACK